MSNAAESSPEPQWRSIRHSARFTPHPDEFPAGAAEWPESLGRRSFLKMLAGSIALAGGVACTRQPLERIVPYVRQPEGIQPGEPLYFATAMELGGFAHGLLVRSDDGRPTKIEGNPQHPTTRGRSSVHLQAALLDLYDPDRSQSVRRQGAPSTWEDFLGWLAPEVAKWSSSGGDGVRLLTRRIASPTLREQIAALLDRYPKARWHEHDPAFPSAPSPRLRLEQTDVLLCLDAELFGAGGSHVGAVLDYASRRRSNRGKHRLYAIETMPSLTGAMADHRLALSPTALAAYSESLLESLRGEQAPSDPWAAAVLDDLKAARGRSAVVVGEFQPPHLHALARAMNEALGNIGQTVNTRPSDASRAEPLADLVHSMRSGAVRTLIICGPNPIYDTPHDLSFAEALRQVPQTVHHDLYFNETAARCAWHIPASHFLEAWSDATAFDGTASIVQPLIEPLYATKSAHDVLAALTGNYTGDSYEIVRGAWQRRLAGDGFETAWRQTLHDGVAPGSTLASTAAAPNAAESKPVSLAPVEGATLELVIRPDPHLLDGRVANNAWLQELPKAFTKLTWENAAHLSPATANSLSIEHGDLIELRYRGQSLVAPAWIQPGHADQSVTIHLGYGRTRAGRIGDGLGFDAFQLQFSDAPWGGPGLTLRKLGKHHTFASTQEHQSMEGRAPVRVEQLGKDNNELEPEPDRNDTLYPPVNYSSPAWGMVIDLDTCIGCGTCTIACQAENNIPVVGREQVIRGREMHWIRVDTYYAGSPAHPAIYHQPVPCMHCENAPCEVVCPVGATVHDHDGLNLMVYNRCIGTRYCQNNCPYKVRRFNFFPFADSKTPQLKLLRNPEVSVRSRGVMEKCTYCIQRISAARIASAKENRAIRDGEVVPACAQACPADAIVFGDIADPAARVSKLRNDRRHYGLLAELNTRPRTTYLARRQNPNAALST